MHCAKIKATESLRGGSIPHETEKDKYWNSSLDSGRFFDKKKLVRFKIT